MVRPKKFLGQHFLHDHNIARKIVDALPATASSCVLEIGPGTGILTRYLVERTNIDLKLVEIDRESVEYLKTHYPQLQDRIWEADFLELEMEKIFQGQFMIIGNFPYNISSQIFFKILEYKDHITDVVCMLQKEVAERIASARGNKTYGILSVLLQTFYDIDFLFKVSSGVFTPPPKVMSAVIRLKRNDRRKLECDEKLFTQVVKQGFNYRRKTLRNALKKLTLASEISASKLLDKRAEQLSVEDFISLTNLIVEGRASTS
jgi:16S rRNA (adenine1518-N6/adenine1519-N6)-dimethyltransferase